MNVKRLMIEPRLARADDFYQGLLELHQDLTDEESRLANAKLILLLANHIGDHAVLEEALRIAREGLGETAPSAGQRREAAVTAALRRVASAAAAKEGQ